MRANIRVDLPKRGLFIKRMTNGVAVVDIETEEIKTELSPETDGIFSGFTEARDAAKEFNYFIAYLNIAEVLPNEEFASTNRQQLQDALNKAKTGQKASGVNVAAVQAF